MGKLKPEHVFFFFFSSLFLQAFAEITFHRQAGQGTEACFVWKQWLHFPRETTSGYQAALLGGASHARPPLRGCLSSIRPGSGRKRAIPATAGSQEASWPAPTGPQLACVPVPIPATRLPPLGECPRCRSPSSQNEAGGRAGTHRRAPLCLTAALRTDLKLPWEGAGAGERVLLSLLAGRREAWEPAFSLLALAESPLLLWFSAFTPVIPAAEPSLGPSLRGRA